MNRNDCDMRIEQLEDEFYACETRHEAEKIGRQLVKLGAMSKEEFRKAIAERFDE